MYTVITLPNCGYCTRAKNLLTQKGIKYQELLIGRDIDRDTVKSQYPQIQTVPIITNDQGKFIGGYDQLVAEFKKAA